MGMLRSAATLLVVLVSVVVIASGQQTHMAVYDTSAFAVAPADVYMNDYLPLLQGKKVALVMNQSSKVGEYLLLDTLLKAGVRVTKVFVPEHGFRGTENAGDKVSSYTDSATHVPVISLYGATKKPTKEQLKNVDVVVYDLQDVGVRFYTYITTLQYTMEACAENGKDYIVLDRPNPNGFSVDGPVLENGMQSIVGMQHIPIIYGMTAGEYAKMLKGEGWFSDAAQLNLKVISSHNYDHTKMYALPVAPSPNLKTMAAIYTYPTMCLFEGTVMSVGRGTYAPFQLFGHPDFINKFRYSFTPLSMPGATNPLYEKRECYGMVVANNETEALQIMGGRVRINWLIRAYAAFSDQAKFFNAYFDKLAGTPVLKKQIISGMSEADIWKSWEKDIKTFKQIRKKYLLYKDFE